MLPEYGNDQLQVLANLYGKEAMVEFSGKTYTSPPLVNEEEIFAEWRIFKRALTKDKTMMEKKKMSKPPSLQDVKTEMELSGAYRGIFQRYLSYRIFC